MAGVCGATVSPVVPERVSDGGFDGAVGGGVCTMKCECAVWPEFECVPPGWVVFEWLVLGCVSVGDDE